MAREPYDKEHVTTVIRRNPPTWAKMGLAMSYLDLSGIKLSVDTEDDLHRVREAYDAAYSKYQAAVKFYGPGKVHRV
jgi:spore coat polysaccharide biosynthesis protein SpsF (cytidylyltransferase family)